MQSLLRISLLALLVLVVSVECAIHRNTRKGDISQQQPTIVEVDLQKKDLASILASARKEQSVFQNKLVLFLMELVFSVSQKYIFLSHLLNADSAKVEEYLVVRASKIRDFLKIDYRFVS